MIKIGITGGIGSGKSYVCALLSQMGLAVYDCDTAAKEIMHTDPKVISALRQLVGHDVYTAQGEINKPVMSAFLFGNAAHAAAVSSIVHPAVARGFIHFVEAHPDSIACVIESAILLESGLNTLVDKCVCVQAPLDVRISRVQLRDGLTEASIRQRIARQMNEEEQNNSPFDYFIQNDGQTDLESQLREMLHSFKLF